MRVPQMLWEKKTFLLISLLITVFSTAIHVVVGHSPISVL